MSVIGLHADAALNALADCGLKPSDIDGVATAGESPVAIAHYLGITPTWVDGTGVGGCSFMLHVRHAAAAINEGLCTTVLITHGESGRSRVGLRRLRPLAVQPDGPVRDALRRHLAADHVHHSGAALHEDARLHRGRPRHGLGDPARVGGEESPRQLQGPDHGRGRAGLADDRLALPHADVLPGHRRRRRPDPDQRRAGEGFPDQAGLHPGDRARASRRRWSARWRTSPPPRPSVSPARRRSTRPASPTPTSTT